MKVRVSPTLPEDHGRKTSAHYRLAAAMRNTDGWVHIGDYRTRKSANRRYEAEAITTEDGVHQVWGRYAGERAAR